MRSRVLICELSLVTWSEQLGSSRAFRRKCTRAVCTVRVTGGVLMHETVRSCITSSLDVCQKQTAYVCQQVETTWHRKQAGHSDI